MPSTSTKSPRQSSEMAPIAPMVSHGRGGTGNIAPNHTDYVDGEIVRVGYEGDQEDGAWSAGRGGVGNIGAPHVPPATHPHDTDAIPPAAIRQIHDDDRDHHVGRGGIGNVESKQAKAPPPPGKESRKVAHTGLADKLKGMLFKRWKKKKAAID